MSKRSRSNYEILDDILKESQREQGGKWIPDPRHPDGGYWMTDTSADDWQAQQKAVNDIERYLRS